MGHVLSAPGVRPANGLSHVKGSTDRPLIDATIPDFLAEVANYWTTDPLEAELAPQPGPPAWAVTAAAAGMHGATCS